MQESQLETQVKKSKFFRIVNEFGQWRQPENRTYFDHYLLNAIKIVFGGNPIDYRHNSHKNTVVHSFIYGIDDAVNGISQRNMVVNSIILNPESGKFE